MVGFVHNHVRYHDTERAGSVFDTLRDRVGDCTEFADLYTTLARAIDLPARTVIGLAYQATLTEGAGAFALHAWNEVAIDGFWRSVDPTWGQTVADVTHLTLPEGGGPGVHRRGAESQVRGVGNGVLNGSRRREPEASLTAR